MSWNCAVPNYWPRFQTHSVSPINTMGRLFPAGMFISVIETVYPSRSSPVDPNPRGPILTWASTRTGVRPQATFSWAIENSFGNKYSPDVADTQLGRNGSFAAFRILKQNVARV